MPKAPLPLFDALEHIDDNTPNPEQYDGFHMADYHHSLAFLRCYRGSKGTFNSYRREIERLLHWLWLIAQKNLPDLRRTDIEEFIQFCQKPPQHWIGLKKVPRFIVQEGERRPNVAWRAFVVTLTKTQHRQGMKLNTNKFELSQGATKEIFAILSSYFNYLIQEEYCYMNPVALIRQKSQFIRKQQGHGQIRRLTNLQWETVIATTTTLTETKPQKYERALFILSALYALYLRISELAVNDRWIPQMNHFQRDGEGHWWFKTLGKGNKERQIAVSNSMLNALQRWRSYLGLTALPTPADQTPLLPKQRGKGGISSTTYLREIVQTCFDAAIAHLHSIKEHQEAEALLEATVHWLRHTGISDDVKHRPREHVRDDAGHSSSATTDKYIDIELRARHRSARHKEIAKSLDQDETTEE